MTDLVAVALEEGLGHHQAGRLAEAEMCYRRLLAIDPDHPDGLHLLGVVAYQAGQPDEAAALIGRAIDRLPLIADYHSNLGNALVAMGRLAEAELCYRTALRLKPDFPEAHNNLGNTVRDLDRPAEAVACYRAVLRLLPNYALAHNNLGNALRDLGRSDEAEGCYREALRLRPELAEAHNNLGIALRDRARLDEAEAAYRMALALRPDYPEAHHNLATLLLLAGRLTEAWPEYEWRGLVKGNGYPSARGFPHPRWGGEVLGARVLLVHAEQGFGDTLQFCRYVPLAGARGRVVLEVPGGLVRLVSGLPGVERVVATGDALPDFDVECPLLSLPGVFGTTLETIPASVPYLAADPTAVAMWRARLAALPGLRVGLVWAGDPRRYMGGGLAIDRRRSLVLEQLAPLVGIEGVSFVSLQKGEAAAQACPEGLVLHDWTGELGDFADTAGLVAALDLVISVDTSVAHLAGALGKPVWLLNRYDTCWRWLLGRDDSPWYPSLRQFRQTKPGEWGAVLDAVRTALVARREGAA
ncbi:MAG TPA: tetratricopeptide repeat-containing glycosyltransferase family protein [Stellaceae bacterium]|nr:tetratricopeptide repeat-containing glycosyltransferase family protein [Stellaceae bacterium]